MMETYLLLLKDEGKSLHSLKVVKTNTGWFRHDVVPSYEVNIYIKKYFLLLLSLSDNVELFSWKTTSHKDHLKSIYLLHFYLVFLGCGLH